MMYNYPFFSFPTFRNYNYYPANYASRSPSTLPKVNINNSNFKSKNRQSASNYKSNVQNSDCEISQNSLNTGNKFSNSKKEHDELFEIFGIKLYFDDILLISLIFFLYSEGVKDDYLFISLILLLLS